MYRRLIKPVLSYCKSWLTSLVYCKQHVLFSGPCPAPVADDNYTVVEHREFSASALEDLRRDGRPGGRIEYVARKRFDHGQRLYAFHVSGKFAGSFWLHPHGRRFIDEMGYALELPAGSTFLRDIFVLPVYRGGHLFSVMLGIAIAKYLPDVNVLWSDTTKDNRSSMRAHGNAGLSQVASIRVLKIGRTLMYRASPPEEVGHWSGFKYPQRLVITGRSYTEYVQGNLS